MAEDTHNSIMLLNADGTGEEYANNLSGGVTPTPSVPTWQQWIEAGELSTSDYSSLDEVLADEKAIRRLMTIHASVDYLASIPESYKWVKTIINDDYCAKWINLRDYALDTLYANEDIAALMDESDKYFYGEWVLMPQVPKMTSNTEPYGEASASMKYNDNYPYWRAFDQTVNTDNYGDCWYSNDLAYGRECWIQYKFTSPVCVKKIKFANRNFINVFSPASYKIQGSNNGEDFTDLGGTYTNDNNTQAASWEQNIENTSSYLYYRMFVITTHDINGNISSTSDFACSILQFYAWQPKGNVPVMTSDTAPYGTVTATSTQSGYDAYKAFDGNDTDSNAFIANGSTNILLAYTFTNPICPKKVTFHPRPVAAPNNFLKDYEIRASNDGFATYDILASGTNPQSDNIITLNLNNSNYYLAVGLFVKNTYGGNVGVRELQFYGRELKVSVPKMTSNTDPLGEAFGDSKVSGGNNDYFRPFDGNAETYWFSSKTGTSNIGAYIGYKFSYPIVISKLAIKLKVTNYTLTPMSFNVQASNDGVNYTNLNTSPLIVSSTDVLTFFDVVNDEKYFYYRLYIIDQTHNTTYVGCVAELQFYGLDYSEYDWDEDNPRHYIYDHGVGLEDITLTGTASEENQSLKLIAANDQASKTLDTTRYILLRATVGQNASGTNTLICGSGSATFDTANLPYNQSLDISSINGSNVTGVKQTAAGIFETEEIWLEGAVS